MGTTRLLERDFGSDNRARVCPAAARSWHEANDRSRADSYGSDTWTRLACGLVGGLFDDVGADQVLWVPTGTAANMVAVGSCQPGPGAAVVCASDAHIRVDEAGAIERAWGTPLVCVPPAGGRLEAGAIEAVLDRLQRNAGFSPHPAVLALTVPTEAGRTYTLDEIAGFVEIAGRQGAQVVLDGARFANALARDRSLSAVLDTGVAAVVVGGTKNGLPAGEAVVFADHERARFGRRAAKQLGHVLSKGRFLAAGAVGCLGEGCFLTHAEDANATARSLADKLVAGGVELAWEVDANLVFARLDGGRARRAREVAGAYDWESGLVRFVGCWDHTGDDVEAAAQAVLGDLREGGQDHRPDR